MQQAVLLLQQLRLHRPRSLVKHSNLTISGVNCVGVGNCNSDLPARRSLLSRRGRAAGGPATTAAARVRPCAPIVGGVASSNPWSRGQIPF